jgi:putative endonuclease
MRQFYVYLLASPSRCLYVGVTNDLLRRMHEHRTGAPCSFTGRHGVTRLVYFETTANISSAIAREKQLKRWPRWRKDRLIERENAGWIDLAADWFPGEAPPHNAPGSP